MSRKKGFKQSEKWRKVMKGNKYGSGNKGKKHTEETRRKQSETQRGKKAHNWKGGIQYEFKKIRNGIEFRLWREAIYVRDNWICQKCKKRGGFHPHHIQNFAEYPELRFVINNGITLCKRCHEEFHKIYGYKKNNKKQLEKFLKKLAAS